MPDPTSPDLLTSADRPARLTVRNDAGTIELTPRVVAALIEVMRATCAMRRVRPLRSLASITSGPSGSLVTVFAVGAVAACF